MGGAPPASSLGSGMGCCGSKATDDTNSTGTWMVDQECKEIEGTGMKQTADPFSVPLAWRNAAEVEVQMPKRVIYANLSTISPFLMCKVLLFWRRYVHELRAKTTVGIESSTAEALPSPPQPVLRAKAEVSVQNPGGSLMAWWTSSVAV